MLVCTVPCTSVCHSTVFADNIQVIFPAELIVFGISVRTCEILFQNLYLSVSYQHLHMFSSGIYLKFIFSCIASISLSTTNMMQRFLDLFISINCCTYFRPFLRPSSGAQNCTYSVRYCHTSTVACCYRG